VLVPNQLPRTVAIRRTEGTKLGIAFQSGSDGYGRSDSFDARGNLWTFQLPAGRGMRSNGVHGSHIRNKRVGL